MKTIAIVGAGLAGCSAARMLADEGYKVKLYEKKEKAGGLCTDYVDKYGINVHEYGPHIFHTDDDNVLEFISKFANLHHYRHFVVNENGHEIPPSLSMVKCPDIASKLLSSYECDDDVSIFEFVSSPDLTISDFGNSIYKSFFEIYSKKQWGKSVNVKALDRVKFRLNCRRGYFNDRYEAIPESYSILFANMLSHCNIDLILSEDISYKTMTKLCEENDYVIFTGKVDELLDFRFGELSYRTTDIVIKHYNDTFDYQDCAVVNYTTSENFTRITEYKKFMSNSDECEGTTISFEYPRKANAEDVPMYVVNDEANTKLYAKYLDVFRDTFGNAEVLGRLAEYKYYDMDKVVYRASEVVQKVIERIGNDIL